MARIVTLAICVMSVDGSFRCKMGVDSTKAYSFNDQTPPLVPCTPAHNGITSKPSAVLYDF